MVTPRIVAAGLVLLLALLWSIWRIWSWFSPQWDSQTALAIAVLALTLLAAIWWFWWQLPRRQVSRLAIPITDPKARADAEDNFRKTVGQALGGAAVLLGAGLAYLQFSQQQQTATQQIIAQQKIASEQIAAQQQAAEVSRKASQDLLISNQVAKGFEQLASDKVAMRLGGIYGLEGVMNASAPYHQPVLEALCAFVRDGTIGMIVDANGPATDIQAALTVIGRRAEGPGQVDLSRANIPAVNLGRTNLSGVDLSGANLSSANLFGVDLSGANLSQANLTGAYLSGANLNGAGLIDANLRGADLSDTHLIDAILMGAILNDANLSRADLRITAFDGQEQLDEACGEQAHLPSDLTLKPCPKDWQRAPKLDQKAKP